MRRKWYYLEGPPLKFDFALSLPTHFFHQKKVLLLHTPCATIYALHAPWGAFRHRQDGGDGQPPFRSLEVQSICRPILQSRSLLHNDGHDVQLTGHTGDRFWGRYSQRHHLVPPSNAYLEQYHLEV